MTPWLAIDTSEGTSVAIVQANEVLAEITIDDRLGHAENIGNALTNALQVAKLKSHQINAVVVGRGPAPFTGLRVGIAAAITFAAGIARPVFSVVSHDAIAFAFFRKHRSDSPLLVTTDARRREIYWSLYGGTDENGVPTRTDGPHVSTEADCKTELNERSIDFTEAAMEISAVDVALLAMAQAKGDQLSSDLSALYLRAPDATEQKAKSFLDRPVN